MLQIEYPSVSSTVMASFCGVEKSFSSGDSHVRIGILAPRDCRCDYICLASFFPRVWIEFPLGIYIMQFSAPGWARWPLPRFQNYKFKLRDMGKQVSLKFKVRQHVTLQAEKSTIVHQCINQSTLSWKFPMPSSSFTPLNLKLFSTKISSKFFFLTPDTLLLKVPEMTNNQAARKPLSMLLEAGN